MTMALFGEPVSLDVNLPLLILPSVLAGIPKTLESVKQINNQKLVAPSSVPRISINTGESSFFGEKCLVEKVGSLLQLK